MSSFLVRIRGLKARAPSEFWPARRGFGLGLYRGWVGSLGGCIRAFAHLFVCLSNLRAGKDPGKGNRVGSVSGVSRGVCVVYRVLVKYQ